MMVVAIYERRNFKLLLEGLAPSSLGDSITILGSFSIPRGGLRSSVYCRHEKNNVVILPCKLKDLRILVRDLNIKRTPGELSGMLDLDIGYGRIKASVFLCFEPP
jgi:hypothetical protein